MGDIEALQRGEPQVIDTQTLPPGPEVDALLASGVRVYMVVPMFAAGELIGGLSFGGADESFPAEQVSIAQDAAAQFAIAIAQARLYERLQRQAEELELRVAERTQELRTAHAELQATNAELVQLAAELQAAIGELEAFSYSVSHDLRAPLRAIGGFSGILMNQHLDELSSEAQHYLRRVVENTQRMGELIDDLLTFSRLSRRPLQKQLVAPTTIARQVLAELETDYRDRSIEVSIPELPSCRADPHLLKQVFANLLDNALKYTSGRNPAVIQVGCRAAAGEQIYFVQDNGAGFDMRYKDKLFGVFQRLHRVEDFPGTGVGLATVQRIVQRHGGRIWAEAEVDHGASFFFTLEPANSTEREQPSPAR
jgi:light-regulated signal transduction histidine kinase (bacteriophytochrome)